MAAMPSVLIRLLGRGGSSSQIEAESRRDPASRNRLLVDWSCAGQQFVKQHAQRIDVRPCIDI